MPGGIIPVTKVQAPRPRPGLVPRDALVTLASGAPHTRVSLLSAPGGSGKTTLLGLWRLADPRAFAWLTVDASDRDPVRFWTCVIEALRTVRPGAGAAAAGALLSPASDLHEVVLPLLVNELAGWDEHVVLVLDDLHEAEDPRIDASLAVLVELLPPTLHLAIGTRVDPDVPLARLRARDELVELRAAQLAFSEGEAALFLRDGMGLELAPGEAERIQRHTEGWAAGLQLAGLSLRQLGDSLDTGSPFVAEYLLHEVLDRVPGDLHAFLVRTSILERLSGELCDAVTGAAGAAARLAELERRNLFTVALDAQRRWYRYHPLLAEALRTELAPSEAMELHARASQWWAAEGFVPEAISHALAADDLGLAEELVAAHWAEFFNRGWLSTVAGWLAALPAEALQRDTRLWLARAWTALDHGALEEVEPWLEGEDGERAGWASVLSALHRFKSGDVGAALVAPAAEGSAFQRTVGSLVRGIAAFWAGDGATARAAFAEAVPLALRDGNTVGAAYGLGYQALDAAERGMLDEAQAALAEVGELAEREPPIREHFTALMAALAAGRMAERAGDLRGAQAQFGRAVDLARRGAGLPELVGALLADASVLFALGERERAGARVDEASGVLDLCDDPGRLAEELGRARRHVVRRPAADRDELSDAELRVLRLLPSSLSLREIGGELYISHNTVKTHARNIYLKLGVGQRDEAVAAAREAGLL